MRALRGAPCCIHLAARLPWEGDNTKSAALPLFLALNCEGTARLFRAFSATGGRHFVFLSTIGINGTISGDRPFRETDSPQPMGNYAISKLRAEARLSSLAAESGVTLTVLRPPLVYGAGVSGRFAELVERIRQGRLLPLGGIDNQRDLMGVRNLADLLVALVRERTDGTFLVRDRDPVSSTQLVELIAAAYGTKPRLVTLPRPLRLLALRLPVLGPVATRLFGDVRIDDSALARSSSWCPRHTVADEITEMARIDLHRSGFAVDSNS